MSSDGVKAPPSQIGRGSRCATVTVDGAAVESGSPSGPVAVSEGTVVTVRVTAPDGATTKDYVLTVDRQPPWILE